MRRNSEVILIPDIRERNDRPKDRQPKHQVTSPVQRQMVQKFVKELNDSAKQPDRSDSAEHTATEQVETTAREIAHEAVQLPRSFSRQATHAETPEHLQPEQPTYPRQTLDTPRQRTETVRTRPDTLLRSTPTPTPQEQGRRAYIQQAAKAAAIPTITPESPQERPTPAVPTRENVPRQNLQSPRQRTEDIRTRPESRTPQSAPAPAPQEQGRRAYIQQTAKAAAAPPITPESPQEHPAPVVPTLENVPRQVPETPRFRADDIRLRPESDAPQHTSSPAPQELGRRAFVRQAKKSHAEKTPAKDIHTEPPEIRIAEDLPEREPPRIREKPTITELRDEMPVEPTPEKAPNVRHIKQAGTWTPRNAEPSNRKVELLTHERTVDVPPHDLPPTPQAQAREIFAEKQAQLSRNPSIESIYPPEPPAPVPPQLPVSDAPATTPKRQPVTVGSSKSAPPVQQSAPTQAPSTEQLPAIREKPKPNAAPREKSRRGVFIRTKDTEQISTPKAQSKTSVSKIDTKRARKAATQDAQRKMLKKSNSRAARAAVAAAKKLGEAAAKATKELIDALIALGGSAALFVVFSIVIVAGAFLASPLGILFADEQQADDTVPLATAIAEIQGEYHAELEELQNGDYVSIQIVGQAPDWREVVAVFASKVAGAEDGMDVFTLDEERVELLRQVFWDMCEITTETQDVDVPDSDPDDDVDDSHTETALTITITAKTAEQMRLEYSFTKYQNDALDVLLENLGSLNIPMGSLTISQEDAIELLENLPDDLDPARKAVVETAVQLVGRVSYFWGGKSLTIGWDDRWGVPTEVTAAGSGSTGTVRPFGLDCSGFVDWTFYNATNGSYYPGRGGGAATQHSYCTNISWSDAQPGDLVFYPDDSHVGIVGGKDADGNLLIVHCSGGANGVVITGSAGFTSVARPDRFET